MNAPEKRRARINFLSNLSQGENADCFVQLFSKTLRTDRNERPYYRVVFRDAQRQVSVPIWQETPWFEECKTDWQIGAFYKVRGTFIETNFGEQLELQKIRPIQSEDSEDGFSPQNCMPHSEKDIDQLFEDLLDFAHAEIHDAGLKQLVIQLYQKFESELKLLPGSIKHHHCYAGGFLEHICAVLGVAQSICNQYQNQYSALQETKTRDLIYAGCFFHDIGKLLELDQKRGNTAYTLSGELIGHVLLGRDLVREVAVELELEDELLIRLEHIVCSHPGRIELGAAKLPSSLEAIILQMVDQIDSTLYRFDEVIQKMDESASISEEKNSFKRKLLRPLI